jgi:hypothetical protein
MSEAKALVLFAAVLFMLFSVVTVVCIEVGAGGTVLGLVLGLFAAGGGYGSSVIVVRYGELDERRKREEILLSR